MAKIEEPLQKILDQRLPSDAAPRLGVWNSNLRECKNLADGQGIPLLAVWSQVGCFHCQILEKAFGSDAWKNWMAGQKYLFCFVCDIDPYSKYAGLKDDSGNGTIIGDGEQSYYNFCKYPTGLRSYPFVKCYWKQGETYVKNFSVNGDALDKQQGISNGTYEKAGNYCIKWMTDSSGFAAYEPKDIDPDDKPDPPEPPTPPEEEPETPPEPEPMPDQDVPDKVKTMFGLNKDCQILTKDNKILKYTAATKEIAVIGEYDPTQNLPKAKHVE